MTNEKFARKGVSILVVLGLVFSVGSVSAHTVDSENQMQEYKGTSVEKRLDKVKEKLETVQYGLVNIGVALKAPDSLTEEELATYSDELHSFSNRLDAAENQLKAIAKKSKHLNESVEETEEMLKEVRSNLHKTGQVVDSILDGDSSDEKPNIHEHMSSSGEIPDGLEEADNPTFEVGSNALIVADHSDEGLMAGAEATIVGAFDTTAYSVTFTPTTGGEPIKNHKWVLHEELVDPGNAPLEEGSTVILEASHMSGMYGATAEIELAKETTVYMIDFTFVSGDERVINHKWVVEDDLAPVE